MNDKETDRLFALGRSADRDPSADLMARVLQAAQENQPHRPQAGTAAPLRRRPVLLQFWRSLTAGIAGGPVLASLGALAIAGVFLGYSASAGMSEGLLAETLLTLEFDSDTTGYEFFPVVELFLSEG